MPFRDSVLFEDCVCEALRCSVPEVEMACVVTPGERHV